MGSLEHSNEHSGYMNGREFVYCLNYYELPKKDTAEVD